jgi:predicted transcriptional regulator
LVKTKKKSSFIHRSRIEIIACILNKATKEVRKTHILYSCNLSFKQFKVYLDLLVDRGLMNSKKVTKSKIELLKTTDEGLEFLKAYRKLKGLIEP